MKKLYIVTAHIDDFECSAYGYLFKHHKEYDKIVLVIASKWKFKDNIILQNLKELPDEIESKIQYINLGYEARKFNTDFDKMKDDFYKEIDWNEDFDILTHDSNDAHTDHKVLSDISMGLYKYVSKYITMYSPSSVNFGPNYFVGLSDEAYQYKKKALDKYDIQKEQSYSKKGYYLQSEDHYNIGKSYVLENCVNTNSNYYEVYKILKWM